MKIGPEGGQISALAIDPATPSILYAASIEAVSKTTDGGATWHILSNSPQNAHSLAVDPANPATLYAGTASLGPTLLKSTNGGVTWAPANNGIPPNRFIAHLSIDPLNTATIYAAATIVGFSGDGVYKSTNGGGSWTAVNGLAGLRTSAVAVDPGNSSTLYVGASGLGILKSTNGGETWASVSSGLPIGFVTSLVFAPGNSSTIYAAGGGLFKSTDGGGSWSALSLNGGLAQCVFDIAIDPTQIVEDSAGSMTNVQLRPPSTLLNTPASARRDLQKHERGWQLGEFKQWLAN